MVNTLDQGLPEALGLPVRFVPSPYEGSDEVVKIPLSSGVIQGVHVSGGQFCYTVCSSTHALVAEQNVPCCFWGHNAAWAYGRDDGVMLVTVHPYC